MLHNRFFSRTSVAFRRSMLNSSSKLPSTLLHSGKLQTSSFFHADQSLGHMHKFRKHLGIGRIQPFSKTGYSYNAAVMEHLFKYPKDKEPHPHLWPPFTNLRSSIFKYISGFCTSSRPVLTLTTGFLLFSPRSPLDFYLPFRE